MDALNRSFEIPGIAQLVTGNGGLRKLCVTASSASAEIYLHGAQVTSWQPHGETQVLFLSEQSHWQDGRAIRGGIPICFPWFRAKADDSKAPAHGFVRTKEWQLDSVTANEDRSVTVDLSTESDETTRRLWPHEFRLIHRITIGKTLRLELIVRNTGSVPLRFEEALHTYFRVSDAQAVRVHGLDRFAFLDNTDGNREKTQTGDLVFKAATDSAYINAHGAAALIDPALHRTLRTEKENSATTVVWNPWQQGAAALADLGDEEWRQMACVEASNILSSVVSLGPGHEHTMRATLTVLAE
ncbi:MAG: D-hexose-6-phosphate mutarotase [Terracidiphilus sp.]